MTPTSRPSASTSWLAGCAPSSAKAPPGAATWWRSPATAIAGNAAAATTTPDEGLPLPEVPGPGAAARESREDHVGRRLLLRPVGVTLAGVDQEEAARLHHALVGA